MSTLSYDERLQFVKDNLVMPGTPSYGDDMLKLISLTTNLTVAYQKKKPETKPYHVLVAAAGAPDMVSSKEMYTTISLMCEMFILNNTTLSTFGFTSASEMKEDIKRILGDWIPF